MLESEVQGLCCDQVSSDKLERGGEFLLKLLAAHDFSGLSNLSQQFFESSEQADQTAFVHIGHFAANWLVFVEWVRVELDVPNLRECRAL